MTNGQGAGAVTGAFLSGLQSVIGVKNMGKTVQSTIHGAGVSALTNIRSINQARDQLDRELSDVLSANALSAAKNMATASALMSASGTSGGTTASVGKQAYVEQILADAEAISQARNQNIGLLNKQLEERIMLRQRSEQVRNQMPSASSVFWNTILSSVGGAVQGYNIGNELSGAMPKDGFKGTGVGIIDDTVFNLFGTTTNKGSVDYSEFEGRKING